MCAIAVESFLFSLIAENGLYIHVITGQAFSSVQPGKFNKEHSPDHLRSYRL